MKKLNTVVCILASLPCFLAALILFLISMIIKTFYVMTVKACDQCLLAGIAFALPKLHGYLKTRFQHKKTA